ncbi:MAG: hypothetical protein E6K53_07200 [Gammaproteobacteria bacterium]|nr:MAG: hypothetical protein E6K53_07200 [Gammaproteobacteria bacterium]
MRAFDTRYLLVLCVALGLCACGTQLAHYRDYTGDGTFVAHAAPSPICQDGYTVDLGAIDLTRPNELSLRLEGLPAIEATIGIVLSVKNAQGSRADVPRTTALIQLTLRDDLGHIVLSRHERLSEWIGSVGLDSPSQVYLYQRGTQIEVALAPGTVRVERFPLGPDNSWGTYFTPRRGARYTLHFAITEPDVSLADVQARLQVNGMAGCL